MPVVPLVRSRAESKEFLQEEGNLHIETATARVGSDTEVRVNVSYGNTGIKFYGEGFAFCRQGDHYDQQIGFDIAYSRAMQSAFANAEDESIERSISEKQYNKRIDIATGRFVNAMFSASNEKKTGDPELDKLYEAGRSAGKVIREMMLDAKRTGQATKEEAVTSSTNRDCGYPETQTASYAEARRYQAQHATGAIVPDEFKRPERPTFESSCCRNNPNPKRVVEAYVEVIPVRE